jgi:hypothetical protein
MARTPNVALYVDVPGADFVWQLKRAALDERKTLRSFVCSVLEDWLREHGYTSEPGASGASSSERLAGAARG